MAETKRVIVIGFHECSPSSGAPFPQFSPVGKVRRNESAIISPLTIEQADRIGLAACLWERRSRITWEALWRLREQ